MIDEYFYMIKHKLFPFKYETWWLDDPRFTDVDKKNITFCYDTLEKVSRSFSHVIRITPSKLSLQLVVFYLRCRALDTVEDDPKAFGGDLERKKKYLKEFYNHFTPLPNVGEEMYRPLLENYDKVGSVHKLLDLESQKIIDDAVKEMGEGMSKYLHYRIDDMEQYNEYCYYVAGVVAIGFSKLFCHDGFEESDFYDKTVSDKGVVAKHNRGGVAISMALFLQKVNISRDYKEDLDEGIQWYPKAVWKKYKDDFTTFNGDMKSRNCLNELVTDALECVPDIFTYHSFLTNEGVFKFCAIPQIMAIATLNELYDNPDVFKKNVKIRKGLSVKLMENSNNMADLVYWFREFVTDIRNRIRDDDPNAQKTLDICNKILDRTGEKPTNNFYKYVGFIIFMISLVIVLKYYNPLKDRYSGEGGASGNTDHTFGHATGAT